MQPRLAFLLTGLCCALGLLQGATSTTQRGLASWYGEAHRGKLMANGQKFDPDQCIAASWAYPLGSRVRVTLENVSPPVRSLIVTITDRGPAQKYVEQGRIIDLSRAAFQTLAPIEKGLVTVKVEPLDLKAD